MKHGIVALTICVVILLGSIIPFRTACLDNHPSSGCPSRHPHTTQSIRLAGNEGGVRWN